MKTITLESVNELKKEFEAYTETAEQNEFPLLFIIERKMAQTFEVIEKDASYIEENQSELRAMFRVVLSCMGKDTSEYEEITKEQGEELTKELIRKYMNWANRKIRAIEDKELKEKVREYYKNSVNQIRQNVKDGYYYTATQHDIELCKHFWNEMVEKVKRKVGRK